MPSNFGDAILERTGKETKDYLLIMRPSYVHYFFLFTFLCSAWWWLYMYSRNM